MPSLSAVRALDYSLRNTYYRANPAAAGHRPQIPWIPTSIPPNAG